MKNKSVTDTQTTQITRAEDELQELSVLNLQLEEQLTQARESERRALADYQNMMRRQQEERSRIIKFATQDLISQLTQPLDHLSLASEQLNNPGLNMVMQQFQHVLENAGLEFVNPLHQAFDPSSMEVVETVGEGDTVLKVVQKGYRLHGQIIRVAKVIVGSK